MRVVCIDDEQLSLDYLELQLNKIRKVDVLATFTNPFEGKQFVLENNVDVVFLDIQMPQMDGIELARKLQEREPALIIVFVTAYESYAIDAFQLNAMDYLVKPIKTDRLQVTMKRIEKAITVKMPEVEDSSPVLRLKVIPYLAFEVEPNVFKPLQWRTAKTQELFLYLIQNSGVLVEKSSILDLLWDDHEVEKAYAILYTTIYNIRKELKPYSEHIILHNRSDGYLLELRQVEIDIVKWEEELQKLLIVDDSTVQTHEKVMELNDGIYLLNYDYIWLEGERHRLNRLWIHKANQMALYYVKRDRIADAIRWYNNILERFPVMEEIHFELMKLYDENGDFTLMMHQYNELNKLLRRELEGKPSEYIVEWYVSKLR